MISLVLFSAVFLGLLCALCQNMAALAATDGDLKVRPRGASPYSATADTYYQGGLVGVVTATGLATPWNNVASTQFQGLCIRTVVAASGDDVDLDTRGVVISHIPIASGVAASVGEKVFCPNDNVGADCALSATSLAIGIIIKVRSASDCDIQLFTPTEAAAAV